MAITIPGMASFMEETKIELDVETSDEAVEQEVEAVEASDAAEEVQEEVAENAGDVAEAEMLNRIFDQCERMEAYVNKYGVDRQFLFMNNMNGELSNMLGISLPACESFDVTGDPKSSTSIACCEGFKEIAKKAWDYIKSIFKKIGAFFSRGWEAIKRRFFSLESNIGRLRKMYEDRQPDDEKLKKAKGSVVSPALLKKIAVEIGTTDGVIEEETRRLSSATSNLREMQGASATEAFSKISEKIDEVSKQIDKQKALIKSDRKESNLAKVAWGDVPNLLNAAADIVKFKIKMDQRLNSCKRYADDKVREAESLANMKEEGADNTVKQARRAAGLWSRYSSLIGKEITLLMEAGGECVKCASQRIAAGSKKV